MKFRILAALMAVIMCFGAVSFAQGEAVKQPSGAQYTTQGGSADNDEDGPSRGDYISSSLVNISSPSSGKIHMSVTVYAKATMQKLGFKSLILQFWDGINWYDVWEIDDQYSLNTTSFSYSVTLTNCQTGYSYRAKCKIYAKKGFLQTQTVDVTTAHIICN